jgi:hypothetical protein
MRRLASILTVLAALVAACTSPTPPAKAPDEPAVIEEGAAMPPAEPELPRFEPLPIPEPAAPPRPPPTPPPAAAPVPPPKPAARLERGTDRPGSDYTNFALDTPDPNACRMACDQEERCRAFSYTAPGVMGEMAYCSLKDAVPAAKPSSCCVSGVK